MRQRCKNICKNQYGDQLNKIFDKACSEGDIERVKYIVSINAYECGLYQLRHANGFKIAKESGQYDIYKFLLTQLKRLDLLQITPLLEKACVRGDLEFVKYVATEKGVDCGSVLHLTNSALENAVEHGHLDIVKFYLFSPEIQNHSNLHNKSDNLFRLACYAGQVDIIKYFLESPDIKTKVNIHTCDDEGFITSCQKNHHELTHYFIFENNIQITEAIEKYLKNKPEIKKLFEIREFKDKIEKKIETIVSKTTDKKNKI